MQTSMLIIEIEKSKRVDVFLDNERRNGVDANVDPFYIIELLVISILSPSVSFIEASRKIFEQNMWMFFD